MQCSQKVGQKKWSHNSSQKTSRTSTPTPPLQKGLLRRLWKVGSGQNWLRLHPPTRPMFFPAAAATAKSAAAIRPLFCFLQGAFEGNGDIY